MRKTQNKNIRVVLSMLVGVAVAWAASYAVDPKFVLLIGWDAAAIYLLASIWFDLYGRSVEHTAEIAKRDDMDHSLVDVVILTAALASVAAVVALIAGSSQSNHTDLAEIGLGLFSVIVSWATVHTLYTLRYATMYYRETEGGVRFDGTKKPKFSDFAYLAFTIGMTYQVSDTDLESTGFRRVALGQALLSFVFGTAIIATSINLVASLIK